MRYFVTAQRTPAHSKVTILTDDSYLPGEPIYYMDSELVVTDCSEAHVSPSPYTLAYTRNLIASLERTRQEIKDLVSALVPSYELDAMKVHKITEQMHRMVRTITDDLKG